MTTAVAEKKVVSKPKTKTKTTTTPKIVDSSSSRFKKMMDKANAVTGKQAKALQDAKPCYSTGCLWLDLAIGTVDPKGNIGFPERSFVEIFGPNHVLKSGTLTQIIISVQKAGKTAVVLYTEEPDMQRLEDEGVDLEKLVILNAYEPMKDRVSKLMLAENMLSNIVSLSRVEEVGLIAIDSLKGLSTSGQIYKKGDGKSEEDRDFYKTETAARANAMEKFFNRIKIHNKKAILVLVNQLNQSPNKDFVIGADSRPETSGGRRKEFEAHFRIYVSSKPIRDKSEHSLQSYKPEPGLEVTYKVVKNRRSRGMSGKKAKGEYIYERNGFNNEKTLLDLCVFLDIIKREGNHFHINDVSYNGRKKAEAALTDRKTYRRYKKELIARRDEIWKHKGDKTAAKLVLAKPIED